MQAACASRAAGVVCCSNLFAGRLIPVILMVSIQFVANDAFGFIFSNCLLFLYELNTFSKQRHVRFSQLLPYKKIQYNTLHIIPMIRVKKETILNFEPTDENQNFKPTKYMRAEETIKPNVTVLKIFG
jgi:hypothetical protein